MSEGGNGHASRTFDWWERAVLPRVRSAPRCALFLDFDGTLAELTTEPDAARLPQATRRVLKTLAGRPKARLFFISGRRRSDLWRRVRLPGCQYLGLFGFEDKPGSGGAPPAAMQRLRAQVESSVQDLPHVWVENKGLAFVLHYRQATPRARTRARRRLRAVLRATTVEIRQFESAHGLEVVPRDVTGKGAAVRRLLRRPALRRAVPIYLGDDLSDEPAFRAARHGVTIRVGASRPTAAQYRIRSTDEARELLELLAKALR
jgi:trehalose 6-phosphate phosphatase